ncbi:MAG: ATP-binding cassette domain-containing protein [Solirubrobacterales bacterium]
MIEIREVTKRYGGTVAVDRLSFTVRPGVVTGFLGPNGAGKSTAMRLITGLDAPTSGTALVNGRSYAEHRAPLREVGLLLEAKAFHPGRTARNHLRTLATTHGIGEARVEEVIELTGLHAVRDTRAGGFSLGMSQRLGIACALLGDPATVILDEPVNGLDPEGVLWARTLLRDLAAEGRTVFLSSHLMSEMALTADHLIVVGRGRLIADLPMQELTARASRDVVVVRTPNPSALVERLVGPEVAVSAVDREQLRISGLSAARIGEVALLHGVVLHELRPQSASLEEAFMELTHGSVEYRGGTMEERIA